MERRTYAEPARQIIDLSTAAATSAATLPWVVTSLAFLALHALCAVLWPEQGWVTAGSVGLQLLLACAFCVRSRSVLHRTMRRKLVLAATGFLLWACVYAAILWTEYVVRSVPTGAFVGDLFAGLRALPFLLALCWPAHERMQPEEWMDVLQAILLSVLLYLFLFPGLSTQGSAPVPPIDQFLSTVFVDLNNTMLLVVAILATLSSEEDHERRVHRAFAVLFAVFVITSAFSNHVVIQRWSAPAGSAWFLVVDLPTVLFLLSFRVSRGARPAPLHQPELRRLVQFAVPIVYSLAGFLFSVAIALDRNHLYLGLALGTMNLLLYAARSARAQMRYEVAHRSLEQANTALHELSGKDSLTGLNNRRAFAEAVQQLWDKQGERSFPLSLLLLDVDFFKRYNDRYGHVRGDECLVSVAHVLTAHLQRDADFLARYGGEEFAVILPQTDADGARTVAERVCEAVLQEDITHTASPFGVVTVSAGVSTFTVQTPRNVLPGMHPSEMIILLADAALYEAKRAGRNCVQAIHTT